MSVRSVGDPRTRRPSCCASESLGGVGLTGRRVRRAGRRRAVDGLAARVDDVGRVDDRAVGADAAVDLLGEPVARADLVVAARDHVALGLVADELVDAAAAVEHVGAEAALEVVGALAALERVRAVGADQAVVAAEPADRAAVGGRDQLVRGVGADHRDVPAERLDALDVGHHVVALARPAVVRDRVEAHRDVGVGLAEVVPGADVATDRVVAVAADVLVGRVLKRLRAQRVVARAAVDRVRAVARLEHVVAGLARERVSAVAAAQRVVAVAAGEPVGRARRAGARGRGARRGCRRPPRRRSVRWGCCRTDRTCRA